MTAKDHNKLLSIFFFVLGGLQVLAGIVMALIYAGVGTALLTAGQRDEDQVVGGIFLGVSVVVGLLISTIGALTLFTAYKLKKMEKIGRTLAIVISILSLFSFPVGTALGIYGLWFLFGDMGKALYGDTGMSGTYTPPPPDSWR